jgi:hypothetical protein
METVMPIYRKPWETVANARLAVEQLRAEGVVYEQGDGTISKRMRQIWEEAGNRAPLHISEQVVNVRCNGCDRSLVAVGCTDTTCAQKGFLCGLRTVLHLQEAAKGAPMNPAWEKPPEKGKTP